MHHCTITYVGSLPRQGVLVVKKSHKDATTAATNAIDTLGQDKTLPAHILSYMRWLMVSMLYEKDLFEVTLRPNGMSDWTFNLRLEN